MQTVPRLISQFIPTHYNLSLTLDRKARHFDGTVTIEGDKQSDDAAIRLHAKDLTVTSVTFDGKAAEFTAGDNDELIISHKDIVPGTHIIVVGFSGTISDAMHGLYPCYYTHDGVKKELLATQFESHHAREAFPCIDEPEAKATFDVTLSTEENITVLGNMPIEWQRVEDEQLVTKFDTTPRMSTYLLAWVTGELHRKTTTTKSGVEVNVWATPAQSPESLDFALDIAKRSIEFYDEYFDTPYPLPKSDHVALPDFSSGAMENWGLITYREICLLADPATTGISSRQYIATVVAHELAHQWFGNLVTMKWWNNLWLNESFANMMEYFAIDHLHPEWNVWLDFATNESIMALRRDSIDGVQAVQVDVHHPDEISTLFDGAIVYAKGGRLLRMLQTYVGETAFQAGLRQYFSDFAYSNTEGDDLWNTIGKASGKDIAALMNTWISQPGYPVVHASKSDSQVVLTQDQFFIGPHGASDRLWPIPLGSDSADMPELMREKSLTVQTGDVPRLNVGDAAHFITAYDATLTTHVLEELRAGSLTPLDRVQLLDEATLLARAGVSSSASLIELLSNFEQETSEPVWGIIALALAELRKFVEDNKEAEQKLRQLSGRIARQEYVRLGWEQKSGEPEEDSKLRATIISLMLYSEDPEALAAARSLYETSSLESLDPELRPLIISSVVRYGDDAIVDSLLDRYASSQTADLAQDICSGITSTRIPEKIDTLLAAIKNPQIVRPQDAARWFAYLIRGRDSREKAWRWIRDNWQWVIDTFGGDKSYDDYPQYSAAGLTTRQQLQEYKDFFEDKKSIPALTRVIELGISEIEARVELIERDKQAVQAALLEL